MPSLAPVLLGGLFGLGAALLLMGVLNVDVVALAIGGVLVVLALQLRHRMQPGSVATARSGDAGGGEGDGEGGPAADGSHEDDERSPPTAAPASERSGVGGDGLAMEAAEDATAVGDDGETLHGSGYRLRDVRTGETVDDQALTLSRDGAQVIPLTVVSDQEDELQVDGFAPGQAVVLVPHRGPEGRVDGIRVFDEVIDHLAGWLPERVAEELAGDLRRGSLPACSLYEWRDAHGRRRGLTVLVHRTDTVVER